MNVSQRLNQIQNNEYDDAVTITGMPKGYFAAIIENKLPNGSNTREITVELMQLQQQEQTTYTTNSGLYIRQPNETAVKVTVKQDDVEKATNTTSYS